MANFGKVKMMPGTFRGRNNKDHVAHSPRCEQVVKEYGGFYAGKGGPLEGTGIKVVLAARSVM